MSEIICVDGLKMFELIERLETELKLHSKLRMTVPNPRLSQAYNGSELIVEGEPKVIYSLKAWLDLAEVCACRLDIVETKGEFVTLEFCRLNFETSVHEQAPSGMEKYGAESLYAQIKKNAEPHFAKDYDEALDRCQLSEDGKVLNLGVNRGDEFEIFFASKHYRELNLSLIGLDHSSSALKQGKIDRPSTHMLCADITALPFKQERSFDALISINTLHASKFDGKEVFREVFQKHLKPSASIILGFPNCRYVDGEVIYGGKMKNFSRHDFSLLLKDLQYYKKYLQKHKKKVFLTGKYTLFLTAIPIK